MTRRLAHAIFWVAQPAGAVAIGLGLLGVAIGRWLLCREAELRGPAALLLAIALAGCQTSRSAENAGTVTQKVEDRGSWGARLLFGPPSPSGSGTRQKATHELGGIAKLAPGGLSAAPIPDVPDFLAQIVGADHGPLIGLELYGQLPVTTTTSTSWWSKLTAALRFGWSPWVWVLGGLALLAGLWGLFRLKAKLGL